MSDETVLEPVEEAYTRWRADQSPDNMGAVLRSLNATINTEVQRFPGPKPLLVTQAKRLAVNAVKTYDPASKAKLRSWVVTNLQPLYRYGHEVASPLHVPEVARRQAAEVEMVRRRLLDELGDDPSDEQLADAVGISVRRIGKLRQLARPVVSEQAMRSEESGEVFEPAVAELGPDPTLRTAAEMVQASLDPRDRTILELKTGLNGSPAVDNATIAKRLGVSPAFVSQRSAVIAKMLMETKARV
jgi:RNA polymerase primary sigma factor